MLVEVDPEDRLLLFMRGRQVAGPIRREDLGGSLAAIAEQHPGQLGVEVREADGRSFSGLLPAPPSGTGAIEGELLTIEGRGFVPGEDVGIAVILRLTSAAPNGNARGLLTREEIPGGPGDVLLFGLTSGTVHRGLEP